VSNGSRRWYRGTESLLSHLVSALQNPCYDWDPDDPVDSGSAI
jgi:hypothetical protein